MRFQTALSAIALAAAAFGQAPSFEVASVKPSSPPDYGSGIYRVVRGGPGTGDPGRWSCDHITLYDLTLIAYDLREFQISAPPWMDKAYFAITAKVPAGATRADLRVMLQHLLTERFKMKVRRETKEIAGYELTVAKDGPKLKESAPLKEGESEIAAPPAQRPRVAIGADGYPTLPPGLSATMTMGFRARRQVIRETMDDLAKSLAGMIGKPVVNATGLKGKYDTVLSYIHDGPGAPPMPGPEVDRSTLPPAADPTGPTIFRAVQDQLGLRMEAKKVPVDFLTIEEAEKTPVEN